MKNCMEMKEIGPRGGPGFYYVDSLLQMNNTYNEKLEICVVGEKCTVILNDVLKFV